MNKKNIIRIISILLLANAFLPIVIKNLPFPLNSTYFWIVAWVATLLFLNIKTFFNWKLAIIFFNLFLFYMLSRSNHSNSYLVDRYIKDILDIFIASTVFLYFVMKKDIKGLKLLLNACLIFIIISSLTSIIGFNIFPHSIRYNAYREMGNMSKYYSKFGIQGYDFFYAIAFASPAIFYKLKKYFKSNKVISIASFIIFFFSIVKANYATVFLFSSVGLFFTLIGQKNFKNNKKVITMIIVLILIVPTTFYSKLLNSVNNFISPESTLHSRISDLSITAEGDVETHGYQRMQRVPYLLKEISKNLLFGGGNSTEHVYWLDLFSLFGIFVFISYISIFGVMIKYCLKIISNQYKYFYMLSILFFFANGFIKNSGGDMVFYSVFLIIPGFGIVERYQHLFNKVGDNDVQK